MLRYLSPADFNVSDTFYHTRKVQKHLKALFLHILGYETISLKLMDMIKRKYQKA